MPRVKGETGTDLTEAGQAHWAIGDNAYASAARPSAPEQATKKLPKAASTTKCRGETPQGPEDGVALALQQSLAAECLSHHRGNRPARRAMRATTGLPPGGWIELASIAGVSSLSTVTFAGAFTAFLKARPS